MSQNNKGRKRHKFIVRKVVHSGLKVRVNPGCQLFICRIVDQKKEWSVIKWITKKRGSKRTLNIFS